MNYPFVSVIVLSYQGKDIIGKCLKKILKSNYPSFEVVVVDNGSTDGTSAYVKRNFKNVRIIRSEKNLGFGGGNNLGFRKTRGKYVAFVNSDAEISKTWLRELVNTAERDDAIAVVGGAVYHSLNFKGTPVTGFLANFITKSVSVLTSEERDVLFFQGAAFLVRRSSFAKPFDETYYLYYEEAFIGMTAVSKGFRVMVNPDAKALHLHPGYTIRKTMTDREWKFYGERNNIINFVRFFSPQSLILLSPIVLVALTNLLVSAILKLQIGYAFFRLGVWLYLLTHPEIIRKARRSSLRSKTVPDQEFFKLFVAEKLKVNSLGDFVLAAFQVYLKLIYRFLK